MTASLVTEGHKVTQESLQERLESCWGISFAQLLDVVATFFDFIHAFLLLFVVSKIHFVCKLAYRT